MPDASWSFLLDTILARVRDQGGLQHSRTLCMDLLTRLQWLSNAQGRFVLLNTTLTVQPSLPLYTLTEATGDNLAGPQGILLTKVTQDNRPLDRITLPQLTALDPKWLRAHGGRLEAFVQLGWNLVILYPCLSQSSTVTITSTKLTTSLTTLSNQDSLDLPPEATPRLGQLLELLLLLRQHDMLPFKSLLATFFKEPTREATRSTQTTLVP